MGELQGSHAWAQCAAHVHSLGAQHLLLATFFEDKALPKSVKVTSGLYAYEKLRQHSSPPNLLKTFEELVPSRICVFTACVSPAKVERSTVDTRPVAIAVLSIWEFFAVRRTSSSRSKAE